MRHYSGQLKNKVESDPEFDDNDEVKIERMRAIYCWLFSLIKLYLIVLLTNLKNEHNSIRIGRLLFDIETYSNWLCFIIDRMKKMNNWLS